MKRSLLVEGNGIPLDRVLAPANRNDSVLLAATLDKLGETGPLPGGITVHLDAGKAPIQAGRRWHVERTNAWHNAFNRLQRCYERSGTVIDAFFDLADAVITLRRLIRKSRTLYRWDASFKAAVTMRHEARSPPSARSVAAVQSPLLLPRGHRASLVPSLG